MKKLLKELRKLECKKVLTLKEQQRYDELYGKVYR